MMRVTDEPRQPVRERGRVVYSTQSTTQAINDNIIKPLTTKEEPVGDNVKVRKLRRGERTDDVFDVLSTLEVGVVIGPEGVWQLFSNQMRDRWTFTYKTKAMIAKTINNVMWGIANDRTSKAPIINWQAPHVYRRIGTAAALAAKASKEITKPAPSAKPMPAPDGIKHLSVVGKDITGNTLYMDPTSGVIGVVEFIPLGVAR